MHSPERRTRSSTRTCCCLAPSKAWEVAPQHTYTASSSFRRHSCSQVTDQRQLCDTTTETFVKHVPEIVRELVLGQTPTPCHCEHVKMGQQTPSFWPAVYDAGKQWATQRPTILRSTQDVKLERRGKTVQGLKHQEFPAGGSLVLTMKDIEN